MSDGWFFGLTCKDNSLQAASTRDPLGFLLLWTAFGSRVVPRLSIGSRGVPNFCAVVAHAWILDTFAATRDLSAFSSREEGIHRLTMVLEALHALSAVHAANEISDHLLMNLPGVDRARTVLDNSEGATLSLDRSTELLVNQAGVGMSGRYKRPLMDDVIGLLGEDGLLNHHTRDEVSAALEPMRDARELILDFLDVLLATKGHALPFEVCADGPIDEELVRASIALRDTSGPVSALLPLLKQALEIEPPGSPQHDLYLLIDTSQEELPRVTYNKLAAKLEEEDRIEQLQFVRDILDLEQILWRVELLFDRLWEIDLSEDLLQVEYLGQEENMLDALLARRDVLPRLLQSVSAMSPTLVVRLKALSALLDKADRSLHPNAWLDFMTSLAHDYHGEVIVETRPGSTPWVTIQGNKAQVLNGGYSPRKTSRGGWRRRYYIHTLRQFKIDAERAHEGEQDGE